MREKTWKLRGIFFLRQEEKKMCKEGERLWEQRNRARAVRE